MTELLTCEFPVRSPDLATPLGKHAFHSAALELNRLILLHACPDVLQVNFERSEQSLALATPNKAFAMRMPDGIEPNFVCAKTNEETYEIEATLPFSFKTRQCIGACITELTLNYPDKHRNILGVMQIQRLARFFAVANDSSDHAIRPEQKTATSALRDFGNTLMYLRSGATIEGYTYSWQREPTIQED